MIICIDFDGTIVSHDFPRVGPEAPGATDWLRRLTAAGARLILWTIRSDGRDDGTNPLSDAVAFCASRGVVFWGVNVNPDQASWSLSPKAYAHVYVDDAAVGCPLITHPETGKFVVDWATVGPTLMNLNSLEK